MGNLEMKKPHAAVSIYLNIFYYMKVNLPNHYSLLTSGGGGGGGNDPAESWRGDRNPCKLLAESNSSGENVLLLHSNIFAN
jgi:hypothetical protein